MKQETYLLQRLESANEENYSALISEAIEEIKDLRKRNRNLCEAIRKYLKDIEKTKLAVKTFYDSLWEI